MDNITSIIIEIPEVKDLIHYFLKNNFPDKKIGTIDDLSSVEKIYGKLISNYDFIILPQTFIEKIDDNVVDLLINNTTSLGEMSNEVQDYYIQQIERIIRKYFYSVNRAKVRKDKYDAKGFYNLKLNSRWNQCL